MRETAVRYLTPRRQYLLCLALSALTALFWIPRMNPDQWFMLLQGEDILAGNLFRTTDFLTLHENLPFLHQKWFTCILTTFLWRLGGQTAIYAATYVLLAAIGALLFIALYHGKPFRTLAVTLPAMIMLTSERLCCFRPQLFAAIILIAEFIILRRHTKLMPLQFAVCSWLMMGFHSTMWIMCLVPLLPYLASERHMRNLLEKRTHKTVDPSPVAKKPLLISLLAMLAASLLQPNGLKQYPYMLGCLLAGGRETAYVAEMQPLIVLVGRNIPAYIRLAAMLLAFAFICALFIAASDRVPLPSVYFTAGGALCCLLASRMCFYGVLFIAFGVSGFAPRELKSVRAASVCTKTAFLVSGITALMFCILARPGIESDHKADYAAKQAAETELVSVLPAGARFFSLDTDLMAWSEPDGLKPYMDSRAEIFTDRLSGGLGIAMTPSYIGNGLGYDGLPRRENWFAEFLEHYDIDYAVFPSAYDIFLTDPSMDGITDGLHLIHESERMRIFVRD